MDEKNNTHKYDYFIGGIALLAFFLLIIDLGSYFNQFSHIIKGLNITILLIFISDILTRFILSKNKLAYVGRHCFDLIVFVPLIQFIQGFENSPSFVVVWQIVIVFMLISRLRKVNKFISLLGLKPAQLMITSFAFAIGTGTVLLMLPIATQAGVKTSLIDALFTATSATCVTGLIVKDTATYFSVFGQMVILGLIQIGGLGIMTFSVSLALLMRKKVQMQRQVLMKDVLDQDMLSSVKKFILFIFKMTLSFELIGALCLFFAWRTRFPSDFVTAYHAFFHSISAFCNAGFSTFSDSLMGFSSDISTNVIIALLIIFGGLGFMVISDVSGHLKNLLFSRVKKTIRLRVQTKVVISTSIFLIVVGALAFYFFESGSTLENMPEKGKIIISFFQSITTRTAGFNSVNMASLSAPVILFMIVFMFVGGSPGSTAGGVKTTTIAVLWATILSGFKQKDDVEMGKRSIPNDVTRKAITILGVSVLIVFVFLMLLLYFEDQKFIDILFETVSAFGTVGLSVGITDKLSVQGKGLISLLMFIGRLGPLTIAYAFMSQKPPAKYKYAQERIRVG